VTSEDAARRLHARPADKRAATDLARHAARIGLRTALAVTGDDHVANDVAQETAVRALRAVRDLRDPDAADAWLHRIATTETRIALRRTRRRRDREGPLDDLAETAPAAEVAPSARAAQAAFDRLPDRQRIALALRYVHDLTQHDIARALKCRPGTAASLLSRGRAALRAEFAAVTDAASLLETR
jgi:RNA polymerase sigma-70 factor (ECF subfamily)